MLVGMVSQLGMREELVLLVAVELMEMASGSEARNELVTVGPVEMALQPETRKELVLQVGMALRQEAITV